MIGLISSSKSTAARLGEVIAKSIAPPQMTKYAAKMTLVGMAGPTWLLSFCE